MDFISEGLEELLASAMERICKVHDGESEKVEFFALIKVLLDDLVG